jgi:hypothetical protein
MKFISAFLKFLMKFICISVLKWALFNEDFFFLVRVCTVIKTGRIILLPVLNTVEYVSFQICYQHIKIGFLNQLTMRWHFHGLLYDIRIYLYI